MFEVNIEIIFHLWIYVNVEFLPPVFRYGGGGGGGGGGGRVDENCWHEGLTFNDP